MRLLTAYQALVEAMQTPSSTRYSTQQTAGDHLGVVLDEVGVVVVGLRYEHHEGLASLHARLHQELGQVVQVAAVALLVVAQGQQLLLPPVPHWGLEGVLAGGHPIQITLYGVDFPCRPMQTVCLKRCF